MLSNDVLIRMGPVKSIGGLLMLPLLLVLLLLLR